MQLMTTRLKLIFLALSLGVSLIYALPNLYGEAPVVELTYSQALPKPEQEQSLLQALAAQKLKPKAVFDAGLTRTYLFRDTPEQLRALEMFKSQSRPSFTAKLNLKPMQPRWMDYLGAKPMKLGLDLRGGVYFLIDVDVASLLSRRMEAYKSDLRSFLVKHKFRYRSISQLPPNGTQIEFDHYEKAHAALLPLSRQFPELDWQVAEQADSYALQAYPKLAMVQDLKSQTLEQTLSTLRNRINELGVAEALIQRQGHSKIVVELPGVQDTSRAREILGKTATLEFLLADDHQQSSKSDTRVPLGSKLYYDRQNRPVFLKKTVILDGSAINGATAAFDPEGRPVVSVTLDSVNAKARAFNKLTQDNIGRALGVVYIESRPVTSTDGGTQLEYEKHERLISLATIQSALGSQFQITGLMMQESRDLALLLRAGALPANVSIVEERVIGPSMGRENIKQGMLSALTGLSLVLVSMFLYYNRFGLIANCALLLNLSLLMALLSILGATLTLPGIAGIVLTLGMAVDANVLVFERIREEIKLGTPMRKSIDRGFSGAWNTILDSNLTTLLIGIILFVIGTGPIRGFAVTLSLGIATSLFTAVSVSRALIHLAYHKKTISPQAIGI